MTGRVNRFIEFYSVNYSGLVPGRVERETLIIVEGRIAYRENIFYH